MLAANSNCVAALRAFRHRDCYHRSSQWFVWFFGKVKINKKNRSRRRAQIPTTPINRYTNKPSFIFFHFLPFSPLVSGQSSDFFFAFYCIYLLQNCKSSRFSLRTFPLFVSFRFLHKYVGTFLFVWAQENICLRMCFFFFKAKFRS